MGRAYSEEAIVKGFPTERAKFDGTRVSSPLPTLNSVAIQQQAPSGPIKNPSRAHFIRQLEEWIDGNQVCSAAHTRDDVGFVETFYEACLNVFQQLWEHIIESDTPFKSKQKSILRESLGRMVLWFDSLGHGQLDSILERSDDLKESVLECLLGISEVIVKEFTPFLSIGTGNPRLLEEIRGLALMNEKARLMNSEDCDSDLESTCSGENVKGGESPNFPFLQDIATFSECLMDLLPGLERSSRVHQQTPMKYIDPSPAFQVSEPASPFVSLVLDRFRKASPRLAQRLGEANWQRYVRIRARNGASDEDVHAHTDSIIPYSAFDPVSLFRDSGLGTTVAASSNYAMSSASHTSFASSLAAVNNDSLRVPDEPAEVALGKPFACAICGHKLYNIKTRIDWKVHVYADLQPYICTWPDCKSELMTFATRKQWANHEFEQHRVERFWRCQECSAELPSLEDWHNHISKAHPNAVPSRSRLGVSAQLAENSRPMDVVDMSCPLCLKKLGPSRRAFATHVGKHMEQLALTALPKGASDESESDNFSIRAKSFESRRMGDESSSKSQSKSESRLSSDHKHPPPYDLKSLYIEYSSAGGICTQQEFRKKLRLLEEHNHTRPQDFVGRGPGENSHRAAAPYTLEEYESKKFGCSFCGAQPQGKHELRRHLAYKHISEPLLNQMVAEIVKEQRVPDAAAIIKCICGFQHDVGNMVICEQCGTRQHSVCYYYRGGGMYIFLKPNHKCADCEPRELDARGAAERMNNGLQQGFGTFSTMIQSPPLPPFNSHFYDQGEQSSNQNTDAFTGAQAENGSCLKEQPPPTGRRSGSLSNDYFGQFEHFNDEEIYSENLKQSSQTVKPSDYKMQLKLLKLQNKKRFRMARKSHDQDAAPDYFLSPVSRFPSPMSPPPVFNQALPLDDDQKDQMGLELSTMEEFDPHFDSNAKQPEQQPTYHPFLTQEQAPSMANPSWSLPSFPTQRSSESVWLTASDERNMGYNFVFVPDAVKSTSSDPQIPSESPQLQEFPSPSPVPKILSPPSEIPKLEET